MATDIRYYDNLFAASSNATEKGIVSVVGQGGPDEIDICHLTALWRYSTTQPNPQTGELEQISLGDSFFGDSAAVILAVHHFNNGIGTCLRVRNNIIMLYFLDGGSILTLSLRFVVIECKMLQVM